MLKRTIIFAVLIVGISCFAKSAIRIDVDGLQNKVSMKLGESSYGLSIINGPWLKNRAKYYIVAHSPMTLAKEWNKYSFSFIPEKDGIVRISFRGVPYKEHGVKGNIPIWVAYDNITITGAEVKNSDFELVNQKNLFNDWSCNTINMRKGVKDAQAGENYIIAWTETPVSQYIELKKGQKVTIAFYAKASDGPFAKASDGPACAKASDDLVYAQASNGTVKKYFGILPVDDESRKGLVNPERGFRWENRIASFKPIWADEKWINGMKANGLTLTQAYCELIDYAEMEQIPEDKIAKLEKSFAALRENGLKVQICFRYEMSGTVGGPTLEIILSHIEQLRPILQRNMDVIAVFQTGFIGLYGEWHRSFHGLDKNPAAEEEVISALLNILPKDRKLIIRYPRHKNGYLKRVAGRSKNMPITAGEAHSMRPEARMGFADHGFMVGKTDASTFSPRPSQEYDYMTQESLFVPMEGEFFWVSAPPWGILKDDGHEAIKRFWEHHYAIFSFAHNNSIYEGWKWKEKYNARYSLDEWKTEKIDPKFLQTNNIPFSPAYFEDANGKFVSRTIFDYVRDHLGYRLELTKGSYPDKATAGKSFNATFGLVNRGFATPINPRRVYLVLIDKDKVYTLAKAKTDARKWYPCDPENRTILSPEYKLNFNAKLTDNIAPGKYKLGIWLPDNAKTIHKDARYAIRLANRDVPWWTGEDNSYGINIVGDITVK